MKASSLLPWQAETGDTPVDRLYITLMENMEGAVSRDTTLGPADVLLFPSPSLIPPASVCVCGGRTVTNETCCLPSSHHQARH